MCQLQRQLDAVRIDVRRQRRAGGWMRRMRPEVSRPLSFTELGSRTRRGSAPLGIQLQESVTAGTCVQKTRARARIFSGGNYIGEREREVMQNHRFVIFNFRIYTFLLLTSKRPPLLHAMRTRKEILTVP